MRADIVAVSRECACGQSGWREHCRASITRVLIELLRRHGSGVANEKIRRLLPVLRKIEDHLHDPTLHLAQLAVCLHVSQPWLRKLFQQALGCSPLGFILRRRIERACLLLKTTDLALKEIAFRCGFTDTAFFHRTFRQCMGLSAGTYRTHTQP